ncbi:MAG TPA: hypothetical protein VEH09_02750 [Thermodesulfobacteriota bacterium]|nr:hypothetical protein [Thermodesulfobacteriota bacterium]
MAEIKSAVELAMERTKGLHLSHEEKEKLKEEEVQSRAHSLVNRYLEIDFHLREVKKELARVDPSQRQYLENLFIEYLVESIDLDRDNDLIFEGIASFREGSKSFLQKMRDLMERYQDQKDREYLKAERDLLAKLENLGVSGSAVQPKVEGSSEWKEALAKFKPAFEEELNKLRKKIQK